MMINKSKFAFIAAVALASIALPAFAQAAPAAHRHRYAHRAVSNSPADAGYRANARVAPAASPVDDPASTGGGSSGYNWCAGHPQC
jgi:cell division septation protein DedD